METQTIGATAATTVIERKLLQTVRNLHPQRAVQVLDFARWLETQPDLNEATEAELTPEQLAAEESVWEAAYLANQDEFRAMARQALQELEAGETWEMVIEQGKLQAQ